MRKAERAAELMHQIHELAAAREYIESLRELSTEVILTATDIPDAQEFYRQVLITYYFIFIFISINGFIANFIYFIMYYNYLL